MAILLKSAAFVACLTVVLTSGPNLLAAAGKSAPQNPSPNARQGAQLALINSAAPRIHVGRAVLQLAQSDGDKKSRRKRGLKTVTKNKRCGVELGRKLKDLPFPAFIRKLAALKTAVRKKVRGRWRNIVKVSHSAQKVRDRFAKIYRRADKIEDSRASNKQKLNAITAFVEQYEAGIKSLRRLGIVEKPSRVFGGGHKTMSESLKVLRVWQRRYIAIVAASAKDQRTSCKEPQKAKKAPKKCKRGGLAGNVNCVKERMGQ